MQTGRRHFLNALSDTNNGNDQFFQRLRRSVSGSIQSVSSHEWIWSIETNRDMYHAFLLSQEYSVKLLNYHFFNEPIHRSNPILWIRQNGLNQQSLDDTRGLITVEAGVLVRDLNQSVVDSGWFLPGWLTCPSIQHHVIGAALSQYKPQAAGFGLQSGLFELSMIDAFGNETVFGEFGTDSGRALSSHERQWVTQLFELSAKEPPYSLSDRRPWPHVYRFDGVMTPQDFKSSWIPNLSHLFLGSYFSLFWPSSFTLRLSRRQGSVTSQLSNLSDTALSMSQLDKKIKTLYDPPSMFLNILSDLSSSQSS